MSADLGALRFVASADVYKAGRLVAQLERFPGGVRFLYRDDYLASDDALPIATTLPLSSDVIEIIGGALPAFFAGLLPEGRRLTVLRSAVKSSLDDELTLLLAVGSDVPGDIQVVPAGNAPEEPAALVGEDLAELDFDVLIDEVDRHGLPGVQDKVSAAMISSPLALQGGRFILKLDPADFPHLVANEAAHLAAARRLGIPVADARVVHDRKGADGLLVRRFDRVRGPGDAWSRLPLEDATQVLGLPPADKYRIDSEVVVSALAERCVAPLVAIRNLYLQFVYAWLTGNGDLHAKNVSILERGGAFSGGGPDGWTIAPLYDLPSTILYGDDSLALPIGGRTTKLKARHWREFAETIGLPPRAARSAETLALRAAGGVDLASLGFEGSPWRGAERELGFRRAELSG